MDIFKVLSRGTKRPGAAAAKHSALAQLPSAGTKTNPQLYHDEVRGMKRKRHAGVDTEAPVRAEELPIVDFFAPPKQQDTPASKKGESQVADRAPSPEAPAPTAAKRLTEEECRQLLRSHRLKIALLSKNEEQNKINKSNKKQRAVLEEKKKKKKKGEEEDSKSKDKKAMNLFPQPLESFGDLRTTYGISRTLAENLIHQSYRLPTEVQMGSLPLLLRPELALTDVGNLEHGVDFLAVAPTGSGKTISFLIPAIDKIVKRRERENVGGVRELEALIVAPTRELVHQIVNEGNKLVQGTGIKIVAMKKERQLAAEQQIIVDNGSENDDDDDDEEEEDDDESDSNSEPESAEEEQKKDATHQTKPRARGRGKAKKAKKPHPETKTDILVTTPQLLLNFLRSGPSGTHKVLPTVRDLILDEADVLLDPLFKETTLGLWTACTNENVRISFWSATMGSNIETLVTQELKTRAEHSGSPQKPFVRLVVGLKDTAVPNIVHKLTYTASEQGKLLALRQLLHPTSGSGDDSGPPLRPPFLVFTQTIDRAMALHEELKYDIPLEAGGSSRIAALHSALADSARSAIMRKFRAGDIWVLITTDVLARGVDFAGVNGVVNYDVPGSAAAYVHRAGRTGRAGRQGGVAVTLYTKEDIPFVKTVANVIAVSEKQAGKTGEQAGVQKWLLDALPNVAKADRKKLKERGVESRRSGNGGRAQITSKSGYERTREHNRRGAMDANKKRRVEGAKGEGNGGEEEWTGLD
ncbi:RNA-dependent ATPase rok1 [Claviceps humidiphila]|uniref:ATP-dependent RNA helicase n=1 Tax=Claviceps humidiphila TaxID=1294629 RepID=A0A9P7PWP4_9HYPO|nr:RNA-dependent ATPase rok1 [Claviceps humidiphila]